MLFYNPDLVHFILDFILRDTKRLVADGRTELLQRSRLSAVSKCFYEVLQDDDFWILPARIQRIRYFAQTNKEPPVWCASNKQLAQELMVCVRNKKKQHARNQKFVIVCTACGVTWGILIGTVIILTIVVSITMIVLFLCPMGLLCDQ